MSLPPDVARHETLELKGRTLRYTVTAGSLPLVDPKGRTLVEIAYTAYTLDGAEAQRRPITFAFNGGPGAASAYLNFGAVGPRRVAFGNQDVGPSSPPLAKPNDETWLDFTDLVFIDPVGTGFSRFAQDGDDLRKQFWSVDGDVKALSRIVAKYLIKTGRLASPKYLLGESYGGFRAPKIADQLQTGEGVGIDGLILLSPVLDFGARRERANAPLPYVALLPSMAAAKLERAGVTPTRAALAEAENYVAGDYLRDFLKGPRDKDALARMVARVSDFTGLDRALVAQLGGRIDMRAYTRERDRDAGKVASAYDAQVSGPDPNPYSLRSGYQDPVLDAATATLTQTTIDYLTRTLGWTPEGRFELLNGEVNRRWQWGNGGLDAPEAMSDLRSVLSLDPRVKVIVAHGFTDLVTPYFENALILNQLPPLIGGENRVRLVVLPGGHMFYTRDDSRIALRAAVRQMIEHE